MFHVEQYFYVNILFRFKDTAYQGCLIRTFHVYNFVLYTHINHLFHRFALL
jgi:hypothetical protein